MTNNISKHGELLKRQFDLVHDNPELLEDDNRDLLKVADIVRNISRFGVSREEITAELLESIDTSDDLRQLVESGYIGANRMFRARKRI